MPHEPVQNTTGWRSLSSAPRDGTRFLVTDGEGVTETMYEPAADFLTIGLGELTESILWWQPLPEPGHADEQ